MMICPETYIKEYRNYTYAQLAEIRNSLIGEIIGYENKRKNGIADCDIHINPSPYVKYKMNQDYLAEVLRLMSEKAGMDESELDLTDTASEDEKITYIRNVFFTKQMYVPDYMFKRAKKLIKQLVDAKNADAINILGALYYEGRGYKQNQKKAVALYKKAAEQGCSLAMANLGYAYMYGNGADINHELAYKYFSMAQLRGEWDAFNKLGDMYKEGLYVTKDENMALYLYYQCLNAVPHDISNDAYPGALRRLGECFLRGIGIAADTDRAKMFLADAVKIYEEQIEEGNYYAKLSIGRAKELLAEAERI